MSSIIPSEPETGEDLSGGSDSSETAVSQTESQGVGNYGVPDLGLLVDEGSKDRCRAWFLTLSGEEYSFEQVKAALADYKGWAGQLERGTAKTEKNPEGYLHWQIYVEHENPIRFTALKAKFPTGSNFQKPKSREACLLYVMKDDTRVEGPWKFGDLHTDLRPGQRNDLTEFTDRIRDGESVGEIIRSDDRALRYVQMLRELEAEVQTQTWSRVFREVNVKFVWGPTGTGKTRGVFDEVGYDDVHRITDYRTAAHPWDTYRGQKTLFLDEFVGQWNLSWMLQVLDGHPLNLTARYANRWAAWDRVIMASNLSLKQIIERSWSKEKQNRIDPLLRRIDSLWNYLPDEEKVEYRLKEGTRAEVEPAAQEVA